MKILAIESSAKAASCAVLHSGVLEAYSFQNVGLTHSRTLLPMIDDMLKNSDMKLSDCDALAVAHGPGSFTGVRIGVAAAKGIALGANLPLYGVSTLEAMAYQSAERNSVVLCAMDARRGEVYAAVFDADGGEYIRLCDDTAAPAAEMSELAKKHALERKKMIVCVGDGAEMCYNILAETDEISVVLAAPHLVRQSAVGVALLAQKLAEKNAAGNAADARPVYLRVSQAEREKNIK